MAQITFDALPTELHLEISSYLDFYNLHMLRGTWRQMRVIIKPLLTLEAPVTLMKLEEAAKAYDDAMHAAWASIRFTTSSIAVLNYKQDYAYAKVLFNRPEALVACGQCYKLRLNQKFASGMLSRDSEKRFCIDCGTQPLSVSLHNAKYKS